MWTTILLFVISLIAYLWYLSRKQTHRNLPPGPKGWPIVGYAPFLRPPMFLAFTNLRDQYGDIVSVKLGSLQFIILNSYDAFKKTLINDPENFSGRIQSDFIHMVSRKCGLLFVEGSFWSEHRRFTLKVLRDFGFGKRTSEDIVLKEVGGLIENLESHQNTPINSGDIFKRSISSVISTLCFGNRPGFEDPEFDDIMKKIDYIAHSSSFLNMLPIIFPKLMVVLPAFYKIFGQKIEMRYTLDCHEYVMQKIYKIRSNMREGDASTNLTEAYLLEQKKRSELSEAADEENNYSDFQLMRLIFELFIAGTDTTATTLQWGLMLLSIHPIVMNTVQKEIDENIGRSRLPTMSDKKSLPYTQAVMDEIARYCSLAPTAIPHRNFRTANVNGYEIPPDCVILPNIYAVHHDPKVWEKPDEFYPEHFLNDKKEYCPREQYVFFGVGKRACLGESLARVEYFIFFVSLLQRFNFQIHEFEKLNKHELLLGTEGTVRAPGEHEIIFSPRN